MGMKAKKSRIAISNFYKYTRYYKELQIFMLLHGDDFVKTIFHLMP